MTPGRHLPKEMWVLPGAFSFVLLMGTSSGADFLFVLSFAGLWWSSMRSRMESLSMRSMQTVPSSKETTRPGTWPSWLLPCLLDLLEWQRLWHLWLQTLARSPALAKLEVKAFRAGKLWVLICTDLMARGVDFKGQNLPDFRETDYGKLGTCMLAQTCYVAPGVETVAEMHLASQLCG